MAVAKRPRKPVGGPKRARPPKPGAGGKIGRYKAAVQPRKKRVASGPGGRERQAPTAAGRAISAGGRERQKPTRRKPTKNLGREGQGRNVGGARARSGDPELRGR